MEKLFYEEKTGKYAKTLSAAKGMAFQKRERPYIYRVWMDKGEIMGKSLIYAYGESVSTIKNADENIERKLNRNEKGKTE